MSEENQVQAIPEKSNMVTSIHQSILTSIKGHLSDSGTVVFNKVVAMEVEKEQLKRTTALVSVIDKLEAAQNELRRVKPAPMGFNIIGEAIGEPMYTKDQLGTIKQIKEKITKFENALSKAVNEHDFTKIYELAGKQDTWPATDYLG